MCYVFSAANTSHITQAASQTARNGYRCNAEKPAFKHFHTLAQIFGGQAREAALLKPFVTIRIMHAPASKSHERTSSAQAAAVTGACTHSRLSPADKKQPHPGLAVQAQSAINPGAAVAKLSKRKTKEANRLHARNINAAPESATAFYVRK